MTKKDFQLIAATINNSITLYDADVRERVAKEFADALATTNQLFKRDLFIQAATGQAPANARRPRDFSGLLRSLASDLAEDR